METPAQTRPSPAAPSFAGLLAAIAKPTAEPANPAPHWNANDLGEDVVTLSYERALRAHARYKQADPGDWGPQEAGIKQDGAPEPGTPLAAPAGAEPPVPACDLPPAATDRDLRSASVTIRVSKAECEQLRLRASEAGVTVSAYLRSCTFEAEALRAQVKEALAELRSAAAQEGKGAKEQGSKEVQLDRVLGHVGNLWLGLSAPKSS
ncbi:MAG: plasmid mobilization protein [Terracidiphilus sp.]